MNKRVYALTFIDNIDGYSETIAVSFDKDKLKDYCEKECIKLDENEPQYWTISSTSFIE